MKRNPLLFLSAAALLLALLVSCGSSDNTETDSTDGAVSGDTAATETTENPYDPHLPAKDYGGATYTFAMAGSEGSYNDITADATDGDQLNDAVYYRNEYIETTYNLDVQLMWCGESGGDITGSAMFKTVSQMILAGEDVIDTIIASPYCQSGFAISGYLLDMTTLDHINFDQPWWDQNALDMLSFYDCVYYTVGDITTIDNRATAVLFFNKKMVEEFDLESPYDVVRSGKWTMDAMIANCKLVAGDLNGDGVMSELDRWGYTFWQDGLYTMMHAGGATVGAINESGEPVYTAEDTHFIEVYEKVLELVDKAYSFNEKMDKNETGTNIFGSGNALYLWGLTYSIINMRDSEIDFGLIPYPKYDEAQETYYSNANAYTNALVSVPITVSDQERAGLILEAYSAKGLELVTPAFYDIQVMTKSIRDNDSAEMLEIIFNNQMYDIGYFFRWGNTFSKVKDGLAARSSNVSSILSSISKTSQADVQATIDAFTAED
ncbi:MAG: extracellular solute-binding protein [Clostridia bacterium]|nr:extracellular solute-binding protein [Clostridia bacterium]MBQ8578770.1 extracellular solute-binding protein [Clostridia bacterium]